MPQSRKSFTETGVQFAWDQTSISAAQRCLRYYKLSILDGWTSLNHSDHLIFGGAYASALEEYYKATAAGCSDDEATCIAVRTALNLTRDWTPTQTNKTRHSLIRTIVWYLDEFGARDPCTTIILADSRPAVELSFSFELRDDIILSGHLDRVVSYEDHTYILDQKTTGSTVGPYYFNQFSPDHQFSLYSLAGNVVFGLPISGVIVDAAQIAVNFSRFARQPVYRSSEQLEEWAETAIAVIETAQIATETDTFTPNFTACNNYGGCPFRQVCSAPPQIRESLLKANYIQKEDRWDPLKAR